MAQVEREYDGLYADLIALRPLILGYPADFIVVQGAGAKDFLQGQLTCDLLPLEVGGAISGLILEPTGKINSVVTVFEVAQDVLVVLCEMHWGELVQKRLQRFAIRVKAEITLDREMFAWISFNGAADRLASLREQAGLGIFGAVEALMGDTVLLGTNKAATREILTGSELSVAEGADVVELFEVLRIERSIAKQGREVTEETIPAALPYSGERLISLSKGCYTGQELVARMESRGNNAPLRFTSFHIVFSSDAPSVMDEPLPLRDILSHDLVGSLTSMAYSPSLGWIGLGYLKRAVFLSEAAEFVLGESSSSSRVSRRI